ncbi:MAG TPA: PilZ domain-containing protein [Terriglobales bacterium]|nr:PilZ domain-containing protein [Terriglobales bacterium]
MNFKALLVTEDEEATATVSAVLSEFGMAVHACGYFEASKRAGNESFHLVIADFDHPEAALDCLRNSSGSINAALLADKAKVRNAFGAGAGFILYKPVSPSQAGATLRAAIAILKRERRHAIRIPVQVPVWIRIQSEPEIEGILLDLSENGMEVLSEHPLMPSGSIGFRFDLSESFQVEGRAEVAWAKPNGQSGIRFSDLSEVTREALKTWAINSTGAKLPEELDSASFCRLTDLSLGAAYVETESPFPEHSGVALRLRAGVLETEAHGIVRAMHPGFGMGIEFASNTPQQREEVNLFIQFLLSRPDVKPDLSVTPFSLPELGDPLTLPPDSYDPLLELLRHQEGFSQQEFIQELHRQRSVRIGDN